MSGSFIESVQASAVNLLSSIYLIPVLIGALSVWFYLSNGDKEVNKARYVQVSLMLLHSMPQFSDSTYSLSSTSSLSTSSENQPTSTVKRTISNTKSDHDAASNMSSSAGERTFSPTELSKFDGTNPSSPIYLAIKGIVFDVSSQRDMYKPGAGYNVFAGKDASRVSDA